MDLKKMLAAKDKAIPESGFNLVELDDFASPGEELTVLANYKTRPEADKALADYKKSNKDSHLAVFASTDR